MRQAVIHALCSWKGSAARKSPFTAAVHTKIQIDGAQYKAPHLFDAVINSCWLPRRGIAAKPPLFRAFLPHCSHVVSCV